MTEDGREGSQGPDSEHGGDPGDGQLALSPLRGLRYAPELVSGLAEVTCPPYDVLDAEGVLAMESSDPHNVVRLILPREEESGPEGRYRHAAMTLDAWIDAGVLRPDSEPGLYVYEQSDVGGVLQRGLVGALGLRDPAERVVLPHEDVMPGPVADRLELMRAAQANVEPILLMYDGEQGAASQVVARVATQPPIVAATDSDGINHRLWHLVDSHLLAAVRADLAGRQALIADGHHRYAAYRALQAEQRAASGPGPWDRGLALLVDLRAYPPAVGAIHRTVAGLDLDDALALSKDLFEERPVAAADVDSTLAALRPGELLLTGPQRAAVLVARDPARVKALVVRGHPEPWGRLDTAVVHHVLADELWVVPDERISYHHDAHRAIDRVCSHGGVAILLAPVRVEDVLAIAAEGVRMPRKSTSFGPKPRTGFVLRSFRLG